MVCIQKSQFDSEPLVKALHKGGGQGHCASSSVNDWDSMGLPNVSGMELHQVGCRDISDWQLALAGSACLAFSISLRTF